MAERTKLRIADKMAGTVTLDTRILFSIRMHMRNENIRNIFRLCAGAGSTSDRHRKIL